MPISNENQILRRQLLDELKTILPEPLYLALESGDYEQIKSAFLALSSDAQRTHRERVNQMLSLLGIQATFVEQLDMEAFLQGFGPYLKIFAAVANEYVSEELREKCLVQAREMETIGFHIADPLRRIYSGERDLQSLTCDLDPNSTTLIAEILNYITASFQDGNRAK